MLRYLQQQQQQQQRRQPQPQSRQVCEPRRPRAAAAAAAIGVAASAGRAAVLHPTAAVAAATAATTGLPPLNATLPAPAAAFAPRTAWGAAAAVPPSPSPAPASRPRAATAAASTSRGSGESAASGPEPEPEASQQPQQQPRTVQETEQGLDAVLGAFETKARRTGGAKRQRKQVARPASVGSGSTQQPSTSATVAAGPRAKAHAKAAEAGRPAGSSSPEVQPSESISPKEQRQQQPKQQQQQQQHKQQRGNVQRVPDGVELTVDRAQEDRAWREVETSVRRQDANRQAPEPKPALAATRSKAVPASRPRGFGPSAGEIAEGIRRAEADAARTSGAAVAGKMLRVWLYGTDEAGARRAIEEAGWATRVALADDVKSCDAVVSAKLSRTGQPIKHMQGQRTASNHNVPFVVVGRQMTRDNLQRALGPLLEGGADEAAQKLRDEGQQLTREAAAAAVNAARITGQYFPAPRPSNGQLASSGH